jgi:hypothetical protein
MQTLPDTATATVPAPTSASGPAGTRPARLWVTWMIVWIEAVIAFSALTIVWRGISDGLFNWISFGSTATPDEFSPEAVDHLFFAFGVLASLTIGWMVMLLFVVWTPFRRGEPWARRAIIASVGTWLVVDSTFSIVVGVPENALLNVVLAIGLVPPMVATRRPT